MLTYTIYVCPDCGNGPEITAFIPGCGPQAIKRGDNLRRCRKCGFKGAYVALEVTPKVRWTGSLNEDTMFEADTPGTRKQ